MKRVTLLKQIINITETGAARSQPQVDDKQHKLTNFKYNWEVPRHFNFSHREASGGTLSFLRLISPF